MSNVISLTSTKPAPLSWVEKLFERMEALYGNKFLDMWRDANADLVKQLWAEEMGKLNSDDLRRGYAALMVRDWPPSLPEFVKMCRPSVDATVAYYEAVNGLHARDRGEMGVWSHAAIFWASAKMAFDLKGIGYSAMKGRWEAALHAEMEKGEWAPIPEPALALPAPGKADLPRDKAKEMLAELGAAGVLKPSTDDRRWARKIMQRVADGDKTLSALQVRFAREALTGKAA